MFKIIEFLDNFTPKKKMICFHSFPDFSDNAYAIFEYISNDPKMKNYHLVWLMSLRNRAFEEEINKKFGSRVKVYNKKSLKGIMSYVRCKYIFFTHGIYGNINSKHKNKRINLWHGMPFKSVGLLDGKDKSELSRQNIFVVTSDLCQDIYSRAFDQPKEKIWILGQPRTDLLFKKSNVLEKLSVNENNFNKKIIWMPTYRKSILGDIRIDGDFKEDRIGGLSSSELLQLDIFLEQQKTLLVVKLHPMDAIKKFNQNYKMIFFLTNQDLDIMQEQLYPLIGEMDAMLTDYSSVYIDFLLLNRPIGFMVDDLDSYSDGRGFLFENFMDYLPGMKIRTLDGMKDFILSVNENNENYEEKRIKVRDLFHLFKDNNSSERIIEKLI